MKKLSLVLAISAVFLAGCSDSSDVQTEPAGPTAPATQPADSTIAEPQQTEPEVKQEEQQIPLGITIKNFEKRYNQFVSDVNNMDVGIRMEKLAFTKLEKVNNNEAVQVFNSCPTKNTCVVGTSETGSGEILSLSITASGDGTEASGLIAMTHLIIGAGAAMPQVKKFNELTSQISTLLNGEGEFTNKLVVHGYNLEFTRSNLIGNWLSIQKLPTESE